MPPAAGPWKASARGASLRHGVDRLKQSAPPRLAMPWDDLGWVTSYLWVYHWRWWDY